jgi:cytochrome c nitrite reductase small subunit
MRNPGLTSLRRMPKGLKWACAASGGACLGLAGYLVILSNGASYLSDDPRACINCHIMRPQYSTWQHSSHGRGTTCNDCHVPHDSVIRKYWFKATDGARHSALFTLRMEPQVIKARQESLEVIQENCVRCHTDTLAPVAGSVHSASDRACIECHREVPHGRVNSLSSTPNAAVPPLGPVLPAFMSKQSDSAISSQRKP